MVTNKTHIEVDKIDCFHIKESREDNYKESTRIWEGTVAYDTLNASPVQALATAMKLKFELTSFRSSDNGGDTVKVTSKKPKGMKRAVWNEICDEVTEFLEDDFQTNPEGWEEMEES